MVLNDAERRRRFCSAVSSADREGRPRFSPLIFFVAMSSWAGNIWRMRLRARKNRKLAGKWETLNLSGGVLYSGASLVTGGSDNPEARLIRSRAAPGPIYRALRATLASGL